MQARSTGEPELLQAQRRRRELREADRANGARRPRRRRQKSTPWLKQNALSVAAISVLVAFLGFGFGLVQILKHPDTSAASLTLAQADLPMQAASTTMLTASAVPGSEQALLIAPPGPVDSERAVHSSARVLEPNYTVAAGDTLVKISQ